jgi:hypothetical protein
MVFLNNQHAGDIPSKYETETRTLICLSSCCVQIQLGVGIAPSRLVARLPRIKDIVPATDLIILIARPCVGDTL